MEQTRWIPHPLLQATARFPEQPALVWERQTWTYRELLQEVGRVIHLLRARGVHAGQVLPIRVRSHPNTVFLAWATSFMGVVWLAIPEPWTDWEIRRVLPASLLSSLMDPVGITLPDVDPSPGVLPSSWPLERPWTVVFTSGSTGSPKGVVHSVGNHVFASLGSVLHLGVQPGDRWWLVLPLYHVGGFEILVRCAWTGATVVMAPSSVDAWAPHLGPRDWISLVPTLFHRWVHGTTLPSTLRGVVVGGGALSPADVETARTLPFPVLTSYGMTETTAMVTAARPDQWKADLTTAGVPLPFARIQIQPLHTQDAPGEILVQGPVVAWGLWEEGTLKERNDLLHTGDLGILDRKGRLLVVGRRGERIRTGGEFVHPEEVEQALLRLPDIQEACVVGLPHPEWGEEVVAVLVGRRRPLEEIRQALRRDLAAYKLPRRVFWWHPPLPRTSTGKLRRRDIRRRLLREYPP